MIRRRVGWIGAGLLAAGAGTAIVRLNACRAPLRVDPLQPSAGRLVVDEHLELARTYAPWIFKEFHPTRGRQDVPAPVDFDGDLRGDDNWEEFPYYELLPTVYYAVLETETHWFVSYHLFHPRDWSLVDLGLHMTHENDGENLQVVVEKGGGRVVLLFTQAHYRGGAYANEGSGFGDGDEVLRGPFVLVDEEGAPDPEGRHACVFVESGGHGIYGVPDRRARVRMAAEGGTHFVRAGWILRPRREGEEVREPELVSGAIVPYQLESLTAKLWPLLASGELVGEGGLVDGALAYSDERITIGVPRYYEADRFSGPWGPDRGISPFAIDFRFGAGEVGALFFGPAERYAERLQVPAAWSLEYVDYPFRRSGGIADEGG